jgi:hypothetical protein
VKKRVLFLVLGVLVIGLMMTSVALADAAKWHTPLDIYSDYADDFVLNGPGAPYTDAELQAYLDDAYVHHYRPHSITDPLDDLVTEQLTRSEFPFTGFQLMIAGIVAVVLVGGGIALRRLSRPHKS